MTGLRISLSIGIAAFSLILAAAPAEALNGVSYVSVFTGSNSNNCTFPTTACSSIPGALSKTEPGGEIKCLDNHQEANAFIGKPITIDCGAPGTFIAGGDGSPAITVDLDEATFPNGVVTLRNLNISGLLGNGLTVPGSDGIFVIGGGAAVHVQNCTIQGFTQQGIDFRPASSVNLFVRDTIISNNIGGGVAIIPAEAAAVRGSLSNVRLDQNGGVGLSVTKSSGGAAAVTVEDTQVEKNAVGLRATGALAFIVVDESTVTYNTVGLQPLSGGKIQSFGNNAIHLNNTNGAPTSTVPLK
jgi:hypothetical protein